LELVAHEIDRLLRDGMAPEEIAVVLRASPAGADLLEEAFLAAGVPYAFQRRRRFVDTSVGRALVGLLRCAGEAPDGELGDLLAWLRAPGLLERPELADRLELAARRSGAVSAGRARELWEQRNWSLQELDHLGEAAGRGPIALIDRAGRELLRLFAAPRRRSASVLDGEDVAEARAGVELVRGERPSPGAVAVLDPLALRARRVRALFVCGLQEGVFPARPRPHALLAEEERRRLAEASGLRLGEHEDPLAAERYLF